MDKAIFGPLKQSGPYQKLYGLIRAGRLPVQAMGLCDGQKVYLAAGLNRLAGRNVLLVTSSEVRASRLAQDIASMTGQDVPVFPARPISLHAVSAASRDYAQRRLQVMAGALLGHTPVVVTTAEALLQPLVPATVFSQSILELSRGQEISTLEVINRLFRAGYSRESRAESPGQFAARGGIIDVFPYGEDNGYRVEFFGDEIDGIRRYDPATQRSQEAVDKALFFPAGEVPMTDAALQQGIKAMQEDVQGAVDKIGRTQDAAIDAATRMRQLVLERTDTLLTSGGFEGIENHLRVFYPKSGCIKDYFADALVLLDETARLEEGADAARREYATEYREAFRRGEAMLYQKEALHTWQDVLDGLGRKVIAIQDLDYTTRPEPRETLWFTGRDIIAYRGQMNRLADDIRNWRRNRYQVIAFAGSPQRAERLTRLLIDLGAGMVTVTRDREINPGESIALSQGLRQGFEDPEEKLVLLGETEVFGAVKAKRRVVRKATRSTIDLFADLQVGDYIVHETQGIGIFRGIVKMAADGQTRDYMQIEYQRGDMLYVPTEQMNRVEKYIGAEGAAPRISRLGGTEWEKAKGRVRAQVKIMADELIGLYAARKHSQGYAFSRDNAAMREFEDSFPYEETPDQMTAIAEIKKDMESQSVMDRLLCGDVGYGKTEVALRAAYKAVLDGKQAAILAPTTVLAYQHYNTITQRFEGSPLRAGMLSRFRTPAQIKQTLKDLAQGKVDLVVGTHRLLSNDVKYRDLGLLIVDEEQRFGVAHKEKIKHMKHSVDVLTMTATPIPRTLHMSMSGIRDISVIETPPEERQPVQTYVVEYQEDLLRDAIMKEIGRGGQVYCLYNRVESMPVFMKQLQELVPEARIVCGHGQMPSAQLEKVMLDFYNGEYDVLLSTTIIENGLDIPRANTLLVIDADRFGLAQLYQLRGRVGRSNRLAYAYFFYRQSKALSEVAEKRLTAIREFTEFGSGFKIAMRDLEIRGAGNLLGAEQHGQMAAVGYAMYTRLIDEAVRRSSGEDIPDEVDSTLEIKVDAHIPDEYIPDMTSRLEIYRRISTLQNDDDRRDAIDEMVDRYGEPPRAVLRLIDVVMLKNATAEAQIETLAQRENRLHLRFVKDAPIDPAQLLALVGESKGRLTLTAGDPPGLVLNMQSWGWEDFFAQAMELLDKIMLCKYADI